MHNSRTGAQPEITPLNANRATTPISREILAEADTQPFQIIERPDETATPPRYTRTHLSIVVGSVLSIIAAIFLVKSLTTATPSVPDEQQPSQSVRLLASPDTSTIPTQTALPTISATNTSTALAPTSTATLPPGPSSTVAPSVSPTDVPSATPTATSSATPITAVTTTPSETPSSTEPATTGVFTGELVKNGGFEDGDAHWYLDDGTRSAGINAAEGQRALILPAANGYADQTVSLVPGVTYTLSASGLLGSDGDTGEIGIRFTVGSGEPQPITDSPTLIFSGTSYAWQTLTFVVPEQIVDAKLIIWKPSGTGIFAVDDISLRATPTDTGDGTD